MEKGLLKNITPVWCPGCGLHMIRALLGQEMQKMGWSKENTVVVSGIGCSGRSSGYFNVDAIHTTHGRALPVAEGIKLARPELNVVVISGDGDLLGIGGNHLIHVGRRNTDIKVFCNVNNVYAMTGGQLAPTTPKDMKTETSGSQGSNVNQINAGGIVRSNQHYFYSRTSVTESSHFRNAIQQSLSWDGFSFVEIMSICPTNLGKNLGFDTPKDMLEDLRDNVDSGDIDLEIESR